MRLFKLSAILILIVLGTSVAAPKREGGQSQNYKDWLNKDVVYIITEEERQFFKSLKNDEEKENFIQQFWDRRNPDPRSSYNAFKEEHYRRIAYANEHFTSGVPGWRTDRGRIYITFGPPDDVETHPTGGTYNRPHFEGGGTTNRYPWEGWWYRHIDGVGDGISMLFYDQSVSGEYRLAMYPDEADALLNVPGMGLTLAEEMGLADKRDRAYFNPSAWYDPANPQNAGRRQMDSPFSRMEQYFNIQRTPKIKYEDLKSVVTTRISYNTLPYNVRTHYLRLSEDKVLVPITIELNHKDLEFRKDKEFNRAKIEVYGIITGLTNKIYSEWEDPVVREFLDIYAEEGKNSSSTYQRIIMLPQGQRYKLDLVLKDVNSKKVGTLSLPLIVPKYGGEPGLQSSSIILANDIRKAPENATNLDQYVIGDMRVKPNVNSKYIPGQNLVPYMQIYGMEIDQATQQPSLDVTFIIKKDGKDGTVVKEIQSSAENSDQSYYGMRVVLIGKFPIDLPPDKYKLEILVLDKISNSRLITATDFTVDNPAKKETEEDDDE